MDFLFRIFSTYFFVFYALGKLQTLRRISKQFVRRVVTEFDIIHVPCIAHSGLEKVCDKAGHLQIFLHRFLQTFWKCQAYLKLPQVKIISESSPVPQSPLTSADFGTWIVIFYNWRKVSTNNWSNLNQPNQKSLTLFPVRLGSMMSFIFILFHINETSWVLSSQWRAVRTSKFRLVFFFTWPGHKAWTGSHWRWTPLVVGRAWWWLPVLTVQYQYLHGTIIS